MVSSSPYGNNPYQGMRPTDYGDAQPQNPWYFDPMVGESGSWFARGYHDPMGGPGAQPTGFNQFQDWETRMGDKPLAERMPDSYQRLLDSIKSGRTGNQVMEDLLGQFRGSADDLQQFMGTPAFRTIMAFAAKNTPEYQKLQGLQDPTLQAMNVGLGQISSAGARGVQEAMQSLNASGLGRNAGAVAAVKQGGQADTAGRSALFQSTMQQQAYQNERSRLGTLIDLEQQMQQLALGYSPQPRQQDLGASTGDWLELAGTLIGGAFGSPWLGDVVSSGSKKGKPNAQEQ